MLPLLVPAANMPTTVLYPPSHTHIDVTAPGAAPQLRTDGSQSGSKLPSQGEGGPGTGGINCSPERKVHVQQSQEGGVEGLQTPGWAKSGVCKGQEAMDWEQGEGAAPPAQHPQGDLQRPSSSQLGAHVQQQDPQTEACRQPPGPLDGGEGGSQALKNGGSMLDAADDDDVIMLCESAGGGSSVGGRSNGSSGGGRSSGGASEGNPDKAGATREWSIKHVSLDGIYLFLGVTC